MARDWVASWRDVFTNKAPGQEVLAGLTVGAVALPLNLALAVASGVPASAALLAGAIGGGLAALFGGAPLQVSGPAAALSVMVLALSKDYGPSGVAFAAVICGAVSLALSLVAAGKLASKVPESVLAGFMTGVGIKLLDNQFPELLGFDFTVADIASMMHRPTWLHDVSWIAVLCGLSVVLFVVGFSKHKRFPAGLLGIAVVTFLAVYLDWGIERVGEIPSRLPTPSLSPVAADRMPAFLASVAPLALLAAAESLLSARSIRRMAPTTKEPNPNLELFGQGLGNLGSGLMGGMPVTGVVVRTGVNVQSGAKTRLSSLVHASALLGAMLLLSDTIARIPLAALAGLLCVTGVRLLEVHALVDALKHDKLEAVAFLLACAGTVSGRLMEGLVAGITVSLLAQWMASRVGRAEAKAEPRPKNVRAVLDKASAAARKPLHYEQPPEHGGWLSHIRERAQMAVSAFVHPQATVIGKVVLGDHVHIAAGSSVRADEGSPFYIGSNSNVQDGVVIHALKERRVLVGGESWAVYVGQNVSMAHDALVHGPCYIGDDTFIGFKAVVHDSIVGPNCFIGIGAVVVGVEVPAGRFVPHGHIVDSADAVAALPLVSESHAEFNEDVVEVNRGLAVAYRKAQNGSRAARQVPGGRPSSGRAGGYPARWTSMSTSTSTSGRF